VFNLPNYITIVRIVLVPIFFTCLLYYTPGRPYFRNYSLILFLIAMATDALDGFIARKFKWQTELGTFLDPLADKLLLLSGFIGIACSQTFIHKPALWIVVIVVFRDLFIICGLAIIFITVNRIEIRPNLLGKSTTFFQMLTIVSVLINLPNAEWVWLATVVITICSWLLYIQQGIQYLNAQNSKRT